MKWLCVVFLLLAGCASAPQRVEKELPGIELLQDCPEPPADFSTNGELIAYTLALRSVLRECNDDKAVLRFWHESASSQ